MGFNNAYALWLLPLLALIVLMYMLKQQHEELEISSLYLWKKVLAESEVKRPWQKLRNNILMMMQLLAAFMIIMALFNPFLKTGRALVGNIIIVIDKSGSMNAKDSGKTRLETAKSMAEKSIREASNASVFTVVSVDNSPKVEISGTQSKEEAVKAVRALEGTNKAGSVDKDMSMIKAMYNQLDGANVLIYTDKEVSLESMNGEVVVLGGIGENAGISHISYSDEGETFTALVRVENSSSEAMTRELALYGDESLLELRDIELKPNESKSILFEGIPKEIRYLWAEITEEDALHEDNRAYLVLSSTEPKKVLLFSEKNIFMEKAFSSIEGLEVYKTDDVDVSDDGYDLYIFDGLVPIRLPDKGSMFFINPGAGNPYFKAGGNIGPGRADISDHALNQHIQGSSFYIGQMKDIEKPYWADPLINSGQNTAAGAGIFEGRKIAYTAFDIHDSDFALNPSFPIFIYNMASYLTGMEDRGKGYYSSGEAIPFDFAGHIEDAAMEKPGGSKISIVDELLAYGFSDTGETGVYKLSYKENDEKKQRIYAVNFPRQEAAEAFAAVSEGESNMGEAIGYNLSGTDLRMPIVVFVLILLAAEWMVYIRD